MSYFLLSAYLLVWVNYSGIFHLTAFRPLFGSLSFILLDDGRLECAKHCAKSWCLWSMGELDIKQVNEKAKSWCESIWRKQHGVQERVERNALLGRKYFPKEGEWMKPKPKESQAQHQDSAWDIVGAQWIFAECMNALIWILERRIFKERKLLIPSSLN